VEVIWAVVDSSSFFRVVGGWQEGLSILSSARMILPQVNIHAAIVFLSFSGAWYSGGCE
jgi:hypothetical protein